MRGGVNVFPWLDFFLAALLIWATVSGYIVGTRRAGLRLCASMGATLLPLPFAANCARYLRPLVEPVYLEAWGHKVVAVSSIPNQWVYLGPWQNVVPLPAGPGDLNSEQIIHLALNLTGLVFLITVLALIITILRKIKPATEPTKLGILLGLGQGLVMVSTIIILSPIGTLVERGTLISSALTESVAVQLFMPLLQRLVKVIAPFVL